jgi:plasmid stabilization system protein ParE
MPDKFRIIMRKQAATDLEKIFTTIARSSPQSAPEFIERILDAVDGLEIFPHRNVVEGQKPNKRGPVRSLPVPPYLVFFRVVDSQRIVRILRIRHGARRPLKRFE